MNAKQIIENLDNAESMDDFINPFVESGQSLVSHTVDELRRIEGLEKLIVNFSVRISELEKQLDTRTRELIGASFYEHDYKTLMANSEPVAWVYQTKNVDGEPYLTNVSLKPLFGLVTRYGYKEIPLYTTPQTKPLSDEEILEIADNLQESSQPYNINFARAIEERHGIK